MPIEVLLLTLVFFAALLGLLYLVLFLLNKFVHRYAAYGFSGCIIAYLGYSVVTGLTYCGAEPTYVSPMAGEAGDGQMVFNCDGPGGASAYFGFLFVYPAMIALLAWLTHRITRKRLSRPIAQGSET